MFALSACAGVNVSVESIVVLPNSMVSGSFETPVENEPGPPVWLPADGDVNCSVVKVPSPGSAALVVVGGKVGINSVK